MKGNLLVRKESFVWADTAIDHKTHIANLNVAIDAARTAEDQIFSPANLYDFGTDVIFEFLWTDGHDYVSFQQKYAWISADEFQTLFSLYSLLGGSTPGNASTWQEFNAELDAPKSMLGFYDAACPDPLIHNKSSWEQFHALHAATLTFDEQCDNFEYFKKHYKPTLRIPAQTIRNSIDAHQVGGQIIRLDEPPLNQGLPVFGQQTHIHFGGAHPCALNINGSWKHPNASFMMTNTSKRLLASWGFLLPDSCYL